MDSTLNKPHGSRVRRLHCGSLLSLNKVRGQGVKEDKRSLSSVDIRDVSDHEGNNGTLRNSTLPVTPGSTSKRKRFWNSIKRSTRKLRVRSKDRLSSEKKEEKVAQSQPNINTHSNSQQTFESIFGTADHQRGQVQQGFQNERSFSDPGNLDEGERPPRGTLEHSKSMPVERDEEVDSGIAVVENAEAGVLRQRMNALRSHPFYQLEIVLKEGKDLVVRDSCGTSDPYVKFKQDGKLLFRSRTMFKNLNPIWNEKFSTPIEDPFKVISLKTYDYDRGMHDDSMGNAEIDLTTLDLNTTQELKLMLGDPKSKEDYMGYLVVQCTLSPKSQDEKEQHHRHSVLLDPFFQRSMKLSEQAKRLKSQIWSSVVTIVLVEGYNLLPMDDNGLSDPFVKFKLGGEKYKSKWKPKTLHPKWREQFDLYMYDEQTSQLELTVMDYDIGGKNDLMGRAVIDLADLEREVTHTIEQPLEDGAGVIKLLLTISGTQGSETISDLSNFVHNPMEREEIVRRYGILNSLKHFKDVGWLQVKVIKAQGLAAADLNGKSDPFCVLELVNARLQTQTEYKTLCPEWGKIFTFNVKDIHSILEVSVYDEDKDKKTEFLGKLAIPLLRMKNGERKWYALRDRKLNRKAKGAIMLEMDFIYNHLKAAWRTVNPKEEKYMQPEPKFKISVMKRNIDRVSKIIDNAVEGGKFISSCFNWDSKPRSITAFIVYLVITWNFELYMAPMTLLIVFLFQLLIVSVMGRLMKDNKDDFSLRMLQFQGVNFEEYFDEEDEEEEEKEAKKTPESKDEKKGFKGKLHQVQEICLQVQEGMDTAASMGERIKNTFNWTVPWLSGLAVVALFIATIILYYVPVRYLIVAWGINKFTKKLRAPNAINNNELLDFLSRIPSDKELMHYRELRPDLSNVPSKKKKQS
ncbi:multiple C2 and transmembrane domain-containing protein 1-like isoform X5 [Lineus longissimus]|uniref:multiple C2 and transmembrane domain-containing protein 1-like isoform X5 n=1 Tax=Lineus longissimus TaxID=88925 RepID=UPI00315D5FCF